MPLPKDQPKIDWSQCERQAGYEFKDKRLLKSAFTHASGAATRLESNERLEFLGDAVLGLVVCDMLFEKYPRYLEGDLTKIKSIVVSRQTCAKLTLSMQLEQFLIVGKGMPTAGNVPPSLLADVFESLVAAIYLDGGRDAAFEFVQRVIEPEIYLAAEGTSDDNYKSSLQQLAQKDHGATPTYLLVDEKGPDHSKCFKMSANVAGESYSAAWGKNKKEAEQRAACNALAEMKGEPAPFNSDQPE